MNANHGTAFPAACGQTNRGLVRPRNEDSFLCDDTHRVYAVADGLGGLPDGDVASRTAIEELGRILQKAKPGVPLNWPVVFENINRRVVRKSPKNREDEINLGTTLTVVQVLPGQRLRIGHVGDSGVFLFSRNQTRHLTTDHTMEQEEIAARGPAVVDDLPEYFRHTLTQCIGQPVPLRVEELEVAVLKDERVLLYTDGVTKTCTADWLHDLAFESPAPESYIQSLIDYGNAAGGPDNITAIALYF
ncbi:MAG: serine/threonine-protein phosphatase [Puniceicoccales bacterium]|jgi:protein phosphatase|nr:serine/threonine-protein phosphatase [Puniceicoccales bacterium]